MTEELCSSERTLFLIQVNVGRLKHVTKKGLKPGNKPKDSFIRWLWHPKRHPKRSVPKRSVFNGWCFRIIPYLCRTLRGNYILYITGHRCSPLSHKQMQQESFWLHIFMLWSCLVCYYPWREAAMASLCTLIMDTACWFNMRGRVLGWLKDCLPIACAGISLKANCGTKMRMWVVISNDSSVHLYTVCVSHGCTEKSLGQSSFVWQHGKVNSEKLWQ